MPALPFSNSRAGTELDGDDHLSGRVRLRKGRTACCLVVACRSSSTFVHRWIRTKLGSFRSRFCSSSLVTNLARRACAGSFPVFGMAVGSPLLIKPSSSQSRA